MPRVDKTNPTALRIEAARLRDYADRLTAEANSAADAAPGAYVTGGSGRSRSQNKRTARALDKTIDNAVKSVAARKKADQLDITAEYIESGGPERDRKARADASDAEKKEAKATKRSLRDGSLADRLFVGGYEAGLVFADRAVEKNGDYQWLGMLSYQTLVLTFRPDCSPAWRAFIQGYCYPTQIDPAPHNVDRPLSWAQYGSHVGSDHTGRLFEKEGAIWEVNGYWSRYPGPWYYCHEVGNRDANAVILTEDLLPLISAYEATCDDGSPIITGPDGRTYPRLTYTLQTRD